MAVVNFPDRYYTALVDRAATIMEETLKRCRDEGGEDLVFIFSAVMAADTVSRLNDDHTQGMIELAKHLEALLGPMPLVVGRVTQTGFSGERDAQVTIEGWLMQETLSRPN